MDLKRTSIFGASLMATSALALCTQAALPLTPAAHVRSSPAPDAVSSAPIPVGPCNSVLLKASHWLNGSGVNVYSNGSKEGTSKSCAPKAYEQIDGWTMPQGAEWQSTELVNRLYLTKGWMDFTWSGTGGNSSPSATDSMFYDPPPNGLQRQSEGSISYVSPGDAVFVNEYHLGRFVPGGQALVVNTAVKETGGKVPLVSQNSGSSKGADPEDPIIPTLRNGKLTFTSPRGDPYAYATIGIVHAPRAGARLSGAKSVVAYSGGHCALLTSGHVDCWGSGGEGELGDGTSDVSAFPVTVIGVAGTGVLSDVASIASDGGSVCALLTDGAVDCWGFEVYGGLGNGVSELATYPVEVEGVGGSGTLSGVASLMSSHAGYCALLTTGGVDCWGYGELGELGNGADANSGFPVAVDGVGGTGSLLGVATLAHDGYTVCAVLTSGGVDCWGEGGAGALGDGGDSSSNFPVAVEGVGGTGSLTGIVSLVPGYGGYCAIDSGGAVDCWGNGYAGELGNGSDSNSAFPVAVEGVGGAGSLSDVTSLAPGYAGYCAVLTSGEADCWGWGYDGELGSGSNSVSFYPVTVEGVRGVGSLSDVATLVSPLPTSFFQGPSRYCALLTGGGVDCWGDGASGGLGAGTYSEFPYPVEVKGVEGKGLLSSVSSLDDDGTSDTCAVLLSGGVVCWGDGRWGELGSGRFYMAGHQGSAVPVAVVERSA